MIEALHTENVISPFMLRSDLPCLLKKYAKQMAANTESCGWSKNCQTIIT